MDLRAAIASEGGETAERSWPNRRPKAAATLILLDRSGAQPRVLMGKRHDAHVFMPGKYVFPGGRIEREDWRMPVAGALPALVEAKLMRHVGRPSAGRARALALAAIRETFEETGLLIGTKDHGSPPNPPAGTWGDFAGLGVYPCLEGLHLVARAITPPRRPRRFDAAFFAVDASEVAHRVDGVVGADAEFVELAWLTLDEARAIDLATITRIVLDDLADRLAGGMSHHLGVPFYAERHGRWVRESL